MADDFDIIIIGAGIAGTACALRCARAGLSVLLLERGELPGSKNLSGGRLYCHALGELLPRFQQSAPLERRITQETLSLGIVCPLSSVAQSDLPAGILLERLKTHPALHPLLRGCETLEYGAHLVPEGGLHSLPVQYAGEGWLLVGDALRSCVNTGFSIRGMDMALIGAQAAAQTLINACRKSEPQNLFPTYHQDIQCSLLWEVLQRYQHVPALLQRPGWYHQWPALMEDISREIWHQGGHPVAPLRQVVWRQFRRHGLRHLAGDIIRSLRCL